MPSRIVVISELASDHPGYDLRASAAAGALIEALVDAEARHFWHLTRNRFILLRLQKLGLAPGARLIDIGCGSGGVAAALARAGYRVSGVDGHRALLEVAAARPETLTLWLHDLARGLGEVPERGHDAAALFDVLEHLDEPALALADALRCVRPGGLVVGTVPALMCLWSGIDVRSGHRVRYSVRTLCRLLREVPGAELIEIVPFNRLLVPLLWIQRLFVGSDAGTERLIRSLEVPPAPVNALLAGLVQLEQRLEPWLGRTSLQGASLWFALRKHSRMQA